MAQNNNTLPSLQELQKPVPLATALAAEDDFEDCTPCRVTGSAAFAGLGIYTYVSGHRQLRQQAAMIEKSSIGMLPRRMGITGFAAALVGLGLYRLVN